MVTPGETAIPCSLSMTQSFRASQQTERASMGL